MRIRIQSCPVALLCLLLWLQVQPAAGQQVSLPPLDLGATSFLDGVGGPGVFSQEILSPYHAGRINGPNSTQLPGANSVDSFAAITEFAFTTRTKFLGAWYGGEILLPAVHVDVDTDLGIRGKPNGIGDLIFSPLLLQWSEHKLFGKSIFQRLHVVEFILPTGSYRRDRAVNIGSNLLTVNPQYAFTVFLTPHLETTARLHYLWNSKNSSPAPAFNASSIQPGQAVHFNASISYALHPRLRAGVAGYYLKQITDSRIGDRSLPGSREQVGGIGPGLLVNTGIVDIFVHAFFETGAENRPQGTRVVIRIAKVFANKGTK
jgi:hypothetical protein